MSETIAPSKGNPRKPVERLTDIDRWVGRRIYTRRLAIGMQQKELAALVGVRFQQLYKYEAGTNCIIASRLFKIAKALKVDVDFFFKDMPDL